jgi:4-nitrophenyl phosphatase
VSSAYAAAAYLKDVLNFPPDRKVYVLGMQGIEDELDAVGIQHCGGTDTADNKFLPALDFSTLQDEEAIDPSVAAVLCGFDMNINYVKLCKAFKHISRKGAEGEVKANEKGGGCIYMCSNDDGTFPAKGGPWPGAGALSAPLTFASRRQPMVIGKPHPSMLEAIKKSHHIEEAKSLFIGDRLDTDILFANNCKMDSLLVLTGISQPDDCTKEDIFPTYITDSLGDLDQV